MHFPALVGMHKVSFGGGVHESNGIHHSMRYAATRLHSFLFESCREFVGLQGEEINIEECGNIKNVLNERLSAVT